MGMKIADAHCDTLAMFDAPFADERASWNFRKFSQVGGLMQYMAIFTEPELKNETALAFAVENLGKFHKLAPPQVTLLKKKSDFDPEKINIVLSLEGVSPVIDKIENLHAFRALGIRAATLTWNHENYVGCGVFGDSGLTDFGKEFVRECEDLSVIVDVSHLNVAGFKDVAQIAEKPFIASHSNVRSVREHPRNLYDWQIKEIIDRKGFIGVNFYSEFIAESRNRADQIAALVRHFDEFLNLGAEDVLGFGSDWDGMPESPFDDVFAYEELIDILRNEIELEEKTIEKIAYKNLVDFTLRSLPKD